MNIKLISKEFRKGSCQGIYVYANEIYRGINYSVDQVMSGIKVNSPWRRLFVEQFVLPLKVLFSSSDIYHMVAPEECCWASLFKRNTIVTIHDIIPIMNGERSESFKKYFRFCLNMSLKSRKIIAVSESTKKDLVEHFGIDENKIIVIHHGVDHTRFKPKENKNERFTIGYFGGLGKRKGIDTLIKAVKDLPRDVRVIIGGDGSELGRLKGLVEEEKLDNVEFTGYVKVNEVAKFYQSLDLFVFVSDLEGFGLPLVESMACGVPVITSNVSSMPEIVKDAGICIEPRNPKLLALEINKLIKYPNNLAEMSAKGIERAKDFTWEKSCLQHLKMYNELYNDIKKDKVKKEIKQLGFNLSCDNSLQRLEEIRDKLQENE